MLTTRLRQWFPLEKRKFLLVGALMTALNTLVLMSLVSLLGLSPLTANLIRQLMMTPIHFGLHRKFTWSDHLHDSLWKQVGRYLGLKAGSILSKQLAFWALLSWFGTPYLLAYALCVCVFGLSKYRLTKRLVFRDKNVRAF